MKKKNLKNYKPFNFTPRNIRNQAKKTSPIPITPQVSEGVNVPRAKAGNTPENPKNISVNTNNPPANTRKENITVHFVGGVQAI